MTNKIKVLVVDDSALIRKLMTQILNSDPELQVIGTAVDAYDARDKIKQLNPDVLTLDVEMPKMDGVTFLGNLMRLRPMPVVMVSTLTTQGADLTLRALELGAVDFVSKPVVDVDTRLEDCAEEIITKVKTAASASVTAISRIAGHKSKIAPVEMSTSSSTNALDFNTTHKIIAIGSSTGGTEALRDVLEPMTPDCPGIVISQHIPALFSRSFAERMNKVSRLRVMEAEEGQQILPGHAFIAPGGQHLEVVRDGARFRCRLHEGDPVNKHRPSVDVLFDSVAENVGKNAIGVIMTGMGKDGALGMKRMREAGAKNIAQNQDTCVVWGMPRAAVHEGGVNEEVPLNHLANKIVEYSRG